MRNAMRVDFSEVFAKESNATNRFVVGGLVVTLCPHERGHFSGFWSILLFRLDLPFSK